MNPEESILSFSTMGLDPTILSALEKMNFKAPSPIQAQAIPLIQQGQDLIALAQTGTGKTAACAIPICNRVDVARSEVQVLIVVPTRELALQYATEVGKIGKDKGVKAFAMLGGEDAGMQQSKLKHGVQVLVATPGRLIDFIYSKQIDLSHVETLVLDEADEMFSMGFADDLDFIIQCLVHSHQTLLFSATMPAMIEKLAKQYMKDPQKVNLIGLGATPKAIDHFFFFCRHGDRDKELVKLIDQANPVQSIIFCHSRLQTEQVYHVLKKSYQNVDMLHAGLTQDVRSIITNKFRSNRIRFLVATDVAARGLDFSHVSHVFIYQIPPNPESYVHRSGRTGRYDKTGVVISLVTQRELSFLKQISRHIQKDVVWIGDPPPPASSSPQRYRGRR